MRWVVCQLLLCIAATARSQNFGSNNGAVFQNQFTEQPPDLSSDPRFSFFDIDLLTQLSLAEPTGNILVSPLSIKATLAMLFEGAVNETAAELKAALRLPDNRVFVRDEFKKLLTQFKNLRKGVLVKMANRIFVNNGLILNTKYNQILESFYDSKVQTLDFSQRQSVQQINQWVHGATNGIIPELVDQNTVNRDTSIVLANALYFKGIWEKSFSEQGTENKCFYLLSGTCQNTPMMDTVDYFKFDDNKMINAKIVELPYAGGEFSMVVVLPNEPNGIHLLARDLPRSLNEIVNRMNDTEIFVSLPRFSIEYNADLVNILPKLHIHHLTGPQARLTNMLVTIDGHVTNLLHKARIEVNEEGTVAAAATGAVVIPLMGSMKPRFRADHPFLFFIRHIPTGTILFEGRVNKPEVAPPQAQRQPSKNRPQHSQQRPQLNNQFSEESNFQGPLQHNQEPIFSTQNLYEVQTPRPHQQQPILPTQNTYDMQPPRSQQPQQLPANTQYFPQQNYQKPHQQPQQQQQQQHLPIGNRQSDYETEFSRQPSASIQHNQEYRPHNNREFPTTPKPQHNVDANFLLGVHQNVTRIIYEEDDGKFVQGVKKPQHKTQ